MTPTDLSELTSRELSVTARAGYLALLLAGLSMSTITGSLWLTEPDLPLRTAVVFAALSAMGCGWVAVALWVLRSRRVLFAFQEMLAADIALLFCSIAFTGGVYLAAERGLAAGWTMSTVFAVLLLVAGILSARAHRKYRRLRRRRDELERRLQSDG